MYFFQPVQIPVRTMFTPESFICAEVVVPNVWIGLEEEATMFVRGHVSRAGNWKHLAVAIEEMFIDCQWFAACEECLVVNPKTGVVRE